MTKEKKMKGQRMKKVKEVKTKRKEVVSFKTKKGEKVSFKSKGRKKETRVFPIIKKVKLDNKTRKGDFYYVKTKKGEQGRYYKAKKGVTKEDYLEARKYGIISKKSGVKGKENIKRQIKKIGEKGEKIEDSLGEGYAETTIKDALKLSPYGMKSSYARLLMNTDRKGDGMPIVRDKELIDILTREENVLKYKHRLAFEITLIGERDEPLARISYIQARKTLNEVIGDVRGSVKVGMDIQDFSPTVATEIKRKGYGYSHLNNGRVKSMNIKIIFRKGGQK